jgi:hypothetical protein
MSEANLLLPPPHQHERAGDRGRAHEVRQPQPLIEYHPADRRRHDRLEQQT